MFCSVRRSSPSCPGRQFRSNPRSLTLLWKTRSSHSHSQVRMWHKWGPGSVFLTLVCAYVCHTEAYTLPWENNWPSAWAQGPVLHLLQVSSQQVFRAELGLQSKNGGNVVCLTVGWDSRNGVNFHNKSTGGCPLVKWLWMALKRWKHFLKMLQYRCISLCLPWQHSGFVRYYHGNILL